MKIMEIAFSLAYELNYHSNSQLLNWIAHIAVTLSNLGPIYDYITYYGLAARAPMQKCSSLGNDWKPGHKHDTVHVNDKDIFIYDDWDLESKYYTIKRATSKNSVQLFIVALAYN